MLNKGVDGKYSEALLRCEPIEWNGLTLFPIKVCQYEQFSMARDGLMLSQQTLPAKYISMRYLEALYAWDFDSMQAEGKKSGVFGRCIRFLILALRLSEAEDGTVPIMLTTDTKEPRTLVSIEIHQEDSVVRITPKDFNTLRPLLAEQNGLELPDAEHNAELEEAEREITAANAADLAIDFEDLLYSVSKEWGESIGNLLDWPIRRFEKAQKAIDRCIGFRLSYLAEAQGCKFKNGNPYPTWKFNRRCGLTPALMSAGEFQKNTGGAISAR